MYAFICVVAVVFGLDILSKLSLLYKEDYGRSRGAIIVDIVCNIAILSGAVWVLAANS